MNTLVVEEGLNSRVDDDGVFSDIQLPSSICPPKESPFFSSEDFPPFPRVSADLPSFHISSLPLEDPVSPQPLGNYVGILPLKTYLNDPEGRDNISISSIRRLNVSVRKPRK